jgi:hypothetical protein
MEVSTNHCTQKWMVYKGKSYEKMDDWGVALFQESPRYHISPKKNQRLPTLVNWAIQGASLCSQTASKFSTCGDCQTHVNDLGWLVAALRDWFEVTWLRRLSTCFCSSFYKYKVNKKVNTMVIWLNYCSACLLVTPLQGVPSPCLLLLSIEMNLYIQLDLFQCQLTTITVQYIDSEWFKFI